MVISADSTPVLQMVKKYYIFYLNNYFNFHVCLSFRASVRACVRACVRVSKDYLRFLHEYYKMSLIKVVWYVLRVKSLHPGSPSHPSQTAHAKTKPRCVHSILKPQGQSSRCPVRLLLPRQSRGTYTRF